MLILVADLQELITWIVVQIGIESCHCGCEKLVGTKKQFQ
jgi:hypothetical protein